MTYDPFLVSIAEEYVLAKEELNSLTRIDDNKPIIESINQELTAMHQQMCELLGIPHNQSGILLARAILDGQDTGDVAGESWH